MSGADAPPRISLRAYAQDILGYTAFRGIAAVIRRLPIRMMRAAGSAFAAVAWFVIPVRKRLTITQLRDAFPSTSDRAIRRIARASLRNLVLTIFELMWMPNFTPEVGERIFRARNPDILRSAHQRGRGVILLSAHYGNWEWLSVFARRFYGLPITIIVHPLHNARVDALVEGWRRMHGNRTVPMGLAVREILRTLHDRGLVALLADQSGPSGSIYVPFFGRLAATYEGPAVFALRSGAPIVLGLAHRMPDGSFELDLEEIRMDDLHGVTEENVRELTRRHVEALEQAVRKRPEQWLWQHRRWKHRPEAGARIAGGPSG